MDAGQSETERGEGDRALSGLNAAIQALEIPVRPPEKSLAILEKLGPSPFERGGFPLIGFLATAYDKVTQYALERARESDSRSARERPPSSTVPAE